MKRRTFLAATALALTLPTISLGDTMVKYRPGLVQETLAEGKTVLLDYAAKWCSTCARQERVIFGLRNDNPAYDEEIVFIRVDWDKFGRHEVTRSRNVPRRSTLVLLRGDEELGRIVAGTSKGQIKELLDKGLEPSS